MAEAAGFDDIVRTDAINQQRTQNLISNNFMHAFGTLLLSVTQKGCENIYTTSPTEAAGESPMAQQAAKAAMTTPPPTHGIS